jgi:hypothetical protein
VSVFDKGEQIDIGLKNMAHVEVMWCVQTRSLGELLGDYRLMLINLIEVGSTMDVSH